MAGEEVTFLYPCLSLGLRGTFSPLERLVEGRRVDVVRVATAGGRLTLEVAGRRGGEGEVWSYHPSTPTTMALHPHRRWE